MSENFECRLPQHKAGMIITHNDHKSVYQSAEYWIAEVGDQYEWRDNEAKRQCIESDSIWTIQWYPDTPVGFCSAAAPTLPELLELVESMQ